MQLDRFLEVKPRSSYPESVDKQISLISLTKRDLPIPFGSYIYRFQKYAGDIDTLQTFRYPKEKVVIQQFVKSIRRVINDIKDYRYFSEFKCGIDPYFKHGDIIPSLPDIIGKLKDGVYTPKQNFITNLDTMYSIKLLDRMEYYTIAGILAIINTMTIEKQTMAYDYIYTTIRNKMILRWTENEIMGGYKVIRGKKYTLANALRDKTMIKIDVIALVNGRFMEVTNMLSLQYIDGDNIIPINIDSKYLHDPKALQGEIEKLYYSNLYYSPLKALKRMYSYSRIVKDYRYVEDIVKVIMGDLSLLGQIKAEIECILLLHSKLSKITTKISSAIIHSINEIKPKFSNILSIPLDFLNMVNTLIDDICDDGQIKFEKIVDLHNLVKHTLNVATVMKANDCGLFPPHSFFLNDDYKYDRTQKRMPEDDPHQKYIDFVLWWEKTVTEILREYKI